MTALTIATESYEQHHQISSNPTVHIEQSTLEYLHTAFLLYKCKQTHSKREYRVLLSEYSWDKGNAEEKRSLKIAEHFQAFVNRPEDLAVLPVPVLLRLCSRNYKVLIHELQGYRQFSCTEVLELIEERRAFLKSQSKDKKEGNWRATPDGNRYYTFGKIMEDDQQTGVLTEKLIEQTGLSPQRIVRMAIADLYEKQQTEITQDEIDDFVAATTGEVDVVEDADWEYLQEPEELDIGCEEDGYVEVTNQTSLSDTQTDAEILADILRSAWDYEEVRRGLYQYQSVKEEAWHLLSNSERQSVCQLLPEPIKKLSHAKQERLIVNFYELESGGMYAVFTADCHLIERIVSIHSLDQFLDDLRAKLKFD
ncbi:hypothetical protein NIES4101_64850 [Calothrix sp. NIES-4101]|nr:hypothetical protein NIES4101_64850 [Calothrix sp. NIES-4101]